MTGSPARRPGDAGATARGGALGAAAELPGSQEGGGRRRALAARGRPQASVATNNQSGPYSGTLPEGESITGGHLHHPDALHDDEGVVHPRG